MFMYDQHETRALKVFKVNRKSLSLTTRNKFWVEVLLHRPPKVTSSKLRFYYTDHQKFELLMLFWSVHKFMLWFVVCWTHSRSPKSYLDLKVSTRLVLTNFDKNYIYVLGKGDLWLAFFSYSPVPLSLCPMAFAEDYRQKQNKEAKWVQINGTGKSIG